MDWNDNEFVGETINIDDSSTIESVYIPYDLVNESIETITNINDNNIENNLSIYGPLN